MRTLRALLLGLLGLAACGSSEILHGLDERAANRAVVALDEAGVRGEVRRDPGSEGGFVVEVPPAEAARARQVLASRELPREGPTGFAAAFARGSVVPTAAEERARLLHALAGELGRTLEALDGVVEARVHLAVPPEDPIRSAPPAPPRAAALLKVRPASRDRVEALAPGLRALVAGAVLGLEPERVSVVLADAPAPPPALPAASPPRSPALAVAAVAGGFALLLLGRAALRGWIRLPGRVP
ncbi:MAG TPA: secretion protein [Anaeromyxobacteraceae bacterium]